MRQPQIMPIWTCVPPASRGHMALMVLVTAVWPAVVVASCKGSIGTGQPWFGPLKCCQSVVSWPSTSVKFVWPRMPLDLGVQALTPLLKPPWPDRHQKGYQAGQPPDGSVVSGLATGELITPATPVFSPLLVGSMTQPIQLSVVEPAVPPPAPAFGLGS